MAKILTPQQEKTLKAISISPFTSQFYFSGGTALSHFYLQHRYSEDLDFFSFEEFDINDVSRVIKSIKPKIGYSKIDVQSSFNRYIYMLSFPKDTQTLKVEFVYFPFLQIEKPKKLLNNLPMDSLIDIAANKLFTIAQKPRGRDYFDLFEILNKKKWLVEDLRKKAKIKFDWHIDPLQLGSQLNRVTEFLDDPILAKNISRKKVETFFQTEAKKLALEILKK